MDLAMKLNQFGCLLYKMGRADDAFELFSGAMQAIHHSCGGKDKEHLDHFSKQMLMVDPSIQRAFDRVYNYGFFIPSPPKVCNNNSHKLVERASSTSGSDTSVTSRIRQRVQSLDGTYAYTDVFATEDLSKIPCDDSCRFYVAMSVIFYNEALVLHLGMVNRSFQSLERALTFYSMAGRFLFENCPLGLIQQHDDTSLLCCAILNNTAFLLHQLGEFEASRLCFFRLKELLQTLRPPASQEERHLREEFKLNFILFYRHLSTAAAA